MSQADSSPRRDAGDSMRNNSGSDTRPHTPVDAEQLATKAKNLSLRADSEAGSARKRSSPAGDRLSLGHVSQPKRRRKEKDCKAMSNAGHQQQTTVSFGERLYYVQPFGHQKASQQAKPHLPQTSTDGGHSAEPGQPPPVPRWKPLMQKSKNPAYDGMLLQPNSSPISEQQLAAEIQGIYDGIVTVELKCIDIDAALARDTKTPLGLEQWQALIALHRTLLYEHLDFLMATQHPSASESLRALVMKHNMPAKMWKHGIHAFLEVLRHRRPDSQDYMLAFLDLACNMMALLYETVPSFKDTWIECLGDLTRYRMAIEEDRVMHAVWAGVAARWYTLASDRHPEIGRLYHHLGILERPSMRKFAAYAKSLTSSVPFVNARDSMATFCTPIVAEEHLSRASVGSAEALVVTFCALVFMKREASAIQSIARSGLQALSLQPPAKTKEFGPHLVLSNIAALFEFGSSQNVLWETFSAVVNKDKPAGHSESAAPDPLPTESAPPVASTSASAQVIDFYFACFNTLTRPHHSSQANGDALASVHVVLAWFYSLHSLGPQDPNTAHTVGPIMSPERFSWAGLCLFLNELCQEAPITEGVFEAARQDGFPGARDASKFIPLAEDYHLRGLLWAQLYLPTDLLPSRADAIESPQSGAVRTQRVQWLALSLAFRTEYINYDVHKKAFLAPPPGPSHRLPQPRRVDSLASAAVSAFTHTDFAPSSPTATSSTEDSDGFTLVPKAKKSRVKK